MNRYKSILRPKHLALPRMHGGLTAGAEVVWGRRRRSNHCPTEKACATSPIQRWILVQLLCKLDGESLYVFV